MNIDNDTELALHYGIVKAGPFTAAVKGGAGIIRPSDPFGGLEVDGLTVEGSWQTWGETDDAGSLHVVASGLIGPGGLAEVAACVARMVDHRIRGGRLLDHAFVTLDRDWSVKTHIVTFGSHGFSTEDTYVNRVADARVTESVRTI